MEHWSQHDVQEELPNYQLATVGLKTALTGQEGKNVTWLQASQ